MKRLLCAVAIAAAVMTSACNFAPPATPSTIAQTTKLDEQIARSAELAFKAARFVAETLVDVGVIHGQRAVQVDALREQAYQATKAVRAAYLTGNASSYQAAAEQADAAVNAFLAAIKGE